MRKRSFSDLYQMASWLKDCKVFPGTLVKVAFVSGEQRKFTLTDSAVARRGEVTGAYVLNEKDQLIGGPERVVQVLLNPARLAVHNLSVSDIQRALKTANASADAGHFTTDNRFVLVQAGTFLTRVSDVELTPDTPES